MSLSREQKITEYLKDTLSKSPAHDINHYLRAAAYADRLHQIYGGNIHIILPAILLHDLGREEHISGVDHAVRSAQIARPLLTEIGYSAEEIDKIAEAIVAHDAADETGTFPSLEAKIVHDADRLDGMGALGVVRVVQYCDEKGYGMDGILKRLKVSMPERIEKMALPEAKKIAQEKYERTVRKFTEELENDLQVQAV